jgi:hypothetical protein
VFVMSSGVLCPFLAALQLEESASKVLPKHTPNLNRKSLTMAKSAQSGDFLQRVAKDALKKEHKAMQIKAAHSLDPECTFHPTINPKSKELPARSAVEMSRGDMLKRESAQRLMRLKAEQVCRVALVSCCAFLLGYTVVQCCLRLSWMG